MKGSNEEKTKKSIADAKENKEVSVPDFKNIYGERLLGTTFFEMTDEELFELSERDREVFNQILLENPEEIKDASDDHLAGDNPYDEAWEQVENKSRSEITGTFLNNKYMAANNLKVMRLMFMGFTTIKDQKTDEDRLAVKLIDKGKDSFICASAIIVNSIENSKINEGQVIEIEDNGMGDTKEGNRIWNAKVYVF